MNRLVKWKRAAFAALSVMLSFSLAVPVAYADPLGGSEPNEQPLPSESASNGESIPDHILEDYRVPESEIVNPEGTTINLFDYRVTVPLDENKIDFGDNDPDAGINAGHALKFRNADPNEEGGRYGDANYWTGFKSSDAAEPCFGIVNCVLDKGFPSLSGANGLFEEGTGNGESLAYLFNGKDESDVQGLYKRAYTDVKGLLQTNEEGYYYYTSGGGLDDCGSGNSAHFDEGTNSFVLYDAPGVERVMPDGNSGRKGMFFPFDSPDEVFDLSGDNKLEPERIKLWASQDSLPENNTLNHYFGLSMSTRFVQMNGGKTNSGKSVTYEFSGDDDVWVFIDDVLVGDLGGINDPASLKIDFATGDVKARIEGSKKESSTTIKQCFEDAKKAGEFEWNGNTFADDTIHTLRFYYLERGNTESNMSLKFNLVGVPESELTKVDQSGKALAGAEFELYAANENYDKGSETPICSGTTGESGELRLLDETGLAISFDELYDKYKCDHYVLEEVQSPGSEYRAVPPVHLRYRTTDKDSVVKAGFVVSENTVDTGAYANAKEMVWSCTPEKIERMDGKFLPVNEKGELLNGTMFAVPMKFVGEKDETSVEAKWRGVYGSALNGWELSDKTGEEGAIQAAQAQGDAANVFHLNSSALYQVDIPELPGNIQEYFSLLPSDEKGRAKYAVAYYWTEGSLKDANPDNTYQLKTDNFKRQFAAVLYVPNVYNRVAVQKVDQAGEPLAGAKFGLFAAGDGVRVGDTYRIVEGAKPLATVETRTLERKKDGISLEGAAVFNGRTDDGKPLLEVGKFYFIAEISAPEGYILNENAMRIYVGDAGVSADAGIEGDGVVVKRDPGMLLHTVEQFAENPNIDATLHDIVAQLYTTDRDPAGEKPDTSLEGWAPSGKELHLNFGSKNAIVDYGPREGNSPLLETDADWARLVITQCREAGHGSSGDKTDLSEYKNLSHLFSGLAIVEVTDNQVNSLTVSKAVDGGTWIEGDQLAQVQRDKQFEYTASFMIPKDGSQANGERVPLPEGFMVAIQDANGKPVTDDAGNEVVYAIENGKVAFTLKHGQKAVVKDLPAQAFYEVEEKQLPGFDASFSVNGGAPVVGSKAVGTLADAIPEDGDMTPVDVAYVNTYSLQPAQITLSAKKVLSGRPLKQDEFAFELRDVDGNSLQAKKNGLLGNDGTADVVFDALTFNKEGSYEYSIVEVVPEDAVNADGVSWKEADEAVRAAGGFIKDGVAYDSRERQVSVTVKDNGEGELQAAVAYDGLPDVPVFKNVYASIPAHDVPTVRKTVKPAEGNVFKLEADQFKFTLSAKSVPDGADKPADQVKSNDAQGEATFDELTFKVPGIYEFLLTENDIDPSSTPGVSKDSMVYTITYEVEDNGKGELIVKSKNVTADGKNPMGNTQDIPFQNSYDPAEAKYVIAGTKKLTNQDAEGNDSGTTRVPQAGEFQFALEAFDGAPMPADADGAVKTVSNVSDGTFSFGDITYTKPGPYRYKVHEIEGADSSIEYSKASYEVVVTVTNDGGKLAATADRTILETVFENVYTPDSVELPLSGVKTMIGRDLAEGEFSFVLSDKNGEELQRVANAEDGTFAFEPLSFSRTGTYYYQIAEVAGSLGGVTYDGRVYGVKVDVVEDEDTHGLKAEASVSVEGNFVDEIRFENAYETVAGKIVFSAKKHLEGRDLNEGEFAFELREGETVVARATNGALGVDGYAPVVFDEIVYEEPGEHDYEIVEVKGDAEGVTYDETVFTYYVTVSDNGTGKLEVSCTEGDAGAAVFKNVYKPVKPGDPSDPNTPPDPDDPKAPGDPDQGNSGNGSSNRPSSGFAKTNDGSMLLVGGVLAVAVVAAGAMVLAIRAKRNR